MFADALIPLGACDGFETVSDDEEAMPLGACEGLETVSEDEEAMLLGALDGFDETVEVVVVVVELVASALGAALGKL